jgi:hypothetical protein
MTKVTLGIGGVLLLISAAALVIGGASFGDWAEERGPEMYGDEYWTGDTSSTFSGELDVLSLYYVFVEEGYEVDVHVSGSGYFTSCEEWGDCDFYDLPGYDYVGDLSVDVTSDYIVEFTENEGRSVDVMIRDDKIPIGGIMGLGGGCCGLCGALLLLIIGGIMALTLKDKSKVQTTIQVYDSENVVVKDESNETLYDQDGTA